MKNATVYIKDGVVTDIECPTGITITVLNFDIDSIPEEHVCKCDRIAIVGPHVHSTWEGPR